ncbi:hypothetical protein HHK36_011851 [Tetracentron sinense]|uniref:Uncharacterized protein n=1 Tax=Tetracentron sinense TaxID=13715 RepID=A0A834ZJD5_TETSI|nr:hypothetical protein HHK36_011851 [Tetracentron sinense]
MFMVTVLHVLALYGHTDIVCNLLELPLPRHGLATNNGRGNIALHEAARVGSVEIAEAMVHKEEGLVTTHITKCAELSALSNGVGLQHFASLRRLYICHCKNLKKLPQGIHNLMFLEKLKITCSGLESFPEMGLPSVLRHLEIKECENLKSLPEGIIHNNTFLKFLDILNCDSLTSFPRGGLPTSLEHLSIADCSSLKSLPEGMQNNSSLKKLGVYKVPSLTSFSRGGLPISLEYLYIEDCSNLESLPEGMQNNTSLKDLRIKACHSLTSFARGRLPTSLEYLCINGCSSLQSLPEGMHNNTSLKEMKIQGCHSLTSFPRELWLPTATLKCLEIKDCKNLKSLPEGLHNLKYLDDLIINGCPLLTSFPEGGQPTTLKRFEITDCCKFESLLGLHNFTSLDCLKIEMCPALVSFPAEGDHEYWKHVAAKSNLKVMGINVFFEECRGHEFCLLRWNTNVNMSIANYRSILWEFSSQATLQALRDETMNESRDRIEIVQ